MAEELWTKEYKIERYRRLNQTAEKGCVLFAGSSLMEMFPVEEFARQDNLREPAPDGQSAQAESGIHHRGNAHQQGWLSCHLSLVKKFILE